MIDVINVAKRELQIITGSRLYVFLLFILPVFLFFFLSYVYKTGVVRQIPVAVCDNDNSELSRTFLNLVESTGSIKISKYVPTEADIRNEFLNGNIYAAFVIPHDFESRIKSSKSTAITVYNNTSNLITGNTIYKDASTFIKLFSGSVLMKKIRSKGISENQALNIINPVRIDSRPLYNPNYNYLNYLVPGLLPVVLQMSIMILASLIISSEFSEKKFDELAKAANNKAYAIFLGKALPYLLINSAVCLLIPGIVFPLIGFHAPGSFINVTVLFLLFSSASFLMGILISSISVNRMLTLEAAVFINTPAFIFSGFIFPLSSMPKPNTWFAQIMPFTHFIDAYLKTCVMNAPVKSSLREIFILTVFSAVSVVLTIAIIHYRIKNHGEKKTTMKEAEEFRHA